MAVTRNAVGVIVVPAAVTIPCAMITFAAAVRAASTAQLASFSMEKATRTAVNNLATHKSHVFRIALTCHK